MAISLLSLPLRYFLEVARTGSVNQAAQRLHVAASAVSRQLGKLEDSLGVVLFERQARGMNLTEAGTRLLAHASAHDAQALELVEQLQDLSAQVPCGCGWPAPKGCLLYTSDAAENREV